MKQVIRCGGCNRVIRRNGSFTAELTETEPVFDPLNKRTVDVETIKKIKLCRQCARDAGYKVKPEWKAEFTIPPSHVAGLPNE